MFMLMIRRVVKHNTGATAKFAPRSVNREELFWSGPFLGPKAAQRALLTVLGTHTCLSAEVWSATQIVAEKDRLETTAQWDRRDLFRLAVRTLESFGT